MRKNYERTVFLIAFEGDHWVCRDVLCVFLMCFKCSYPQPPRHALVTVFKCFFKRLDVRGGRRVLSEIRFEAHPKQIQTTTKQTTTVSSRGGSVLKSRSEVHPKQLQTKTKQRAIISGQRGGPFLNPVTKLIRNRTDEV